MLELIQLLKIALVNLAENACKFSERHDVDLHFVGGPQQIEILVVDRGNGIDQEELQMIFEPFYRSARDINRKGHGVGLALVHQVVKIHKGQIFVESQVGSGTIFRLTFYQIGRAHV